MQTTLFNLNKIVKHIRLSRVVLMLYHFVQPLIYEDLMHNQREIRRKLTMENNNGNATRNIRFRL